MAPSLALIHPVGALQPTVAVVWHDMRDDPDGREPGDGGLLGGLGRQPDRGQDAGMDEPYRALSRPRAHAPH